MVNLSYLKLPQSAADPTLGEQEQINLNTTIQVYGNWGVFAEARRDLAKSQMLESSIGITYDDECFVASLGIPSPRHCDVEPEALFRGDFSHWPENRLYRQLRRDDRLRSSA